MDRNDFIKKITGAASFSILSTTILAQQKTSMSTIATNEDYWENLSNNFANEKTVIDLRSNAGSPLLKKVLAKTIEDYKEIQAFPSYRNKEFEKGDKEILRLKIANVINCSANEVALMRNTTEALNNVIMGFPFKQGDEVIAASHEYDSMMASLYQRKVRDGITIKVIDVPYQPSSQDEIVEVFKNNITEKTKLFLISHMVWISGQIYPLKEICSLAKQYGIKTIIDAAQTFSHININVAEIGCDYLGASLHKWCAAPLGSGFLYIKKEMISKTYPLLGNYQYLPDAEDIEKFENFGAITPIFQSAILSIDFWNQMQLKAKEYRMQHLKEYWVEKISKLPNVQMVSNTTKNDSCGVAFFSIKGKSAKEVAKKLWANHKISLQAIENYNTPYVNYKDVNALGVATPVFITKKHLNKFAFALQSIV